jgi:hypothetical protein
VREAIHSAIPYIKVKKILSLRFGFLILYIKKKNEHFRRYKKSKHDRSCSVLCYYDKEVKATIKTDTLRWLKSIDGNLKTEH